MKLVLSDLLAEEQLRFEKEEQYSLTLAPAAKIGKDAKAIVKEDIDTFSSHWSGEGGEVGEVDNRDFIAKSFTEASIDTLRQQVGGLFGKTHRIVLSTEKNDTCCEWSFADKLMHC